MGVAGAGKSTIGSLLSQTLNWDFYEGDDFHSKENREKMKLGIALNDQDREPWLKAIGKKITASLKTKSNAIFTCSALKESYRQKLAVSPEVKFIYLKGSMALIQSRLAARTGHFFNQKLLLSQCADLEEPTEALTINTSLSPTIITDKIIQYLNIIRRTI